ncbi:MAG: SDR family oxidoreductase, partial [Betaproteobacteria bacterium]|nr:SDR family oxidoreductase [Betaproteobacteria bacterium]
AAYGAAKGGVIALTRVMAVELAPHGVTVNALAPGAIETELVKRMHSAETRVVYRAGIPLDRYGTPEETAAAALFLASDEARYITGEVLAAAMGALAAGVMHAARRPAAGDVSDKCRAMPGTRWQTHVRIRHTGITKPCTRYFHDRS